MTQRTSGTYLRLAAPTRRQHARATTTTPLQALYLLTTRSSTAIDRVAAASSKLRRLVALIAPPTRSSSRSPTPGLIARLRLLGNAARNSRLAKRDELDPKPALLRRASSG